MFDEKFEKSLIEKIDLLLSGEVFHDFKPSLKQLDGLKFFFRSSEFCEQMCQKYPNTARQVLEAHGRSENKLRAAYLEQLNVRTESVDSFDALSQILRQFRYEETLRIAWRDLVENTPVEQTLKELSWLADACLVVSVNTLMAWAVIKHGQPRDENNRPVQLVVLAMGKLGADELNFSSDIDLIFCYSQAGNIKQSNKNLSHSEFFVRLCQQLVRVLSENTAYGFVYRVDTRLRPFGNSGQLALSFDAMESYYERHGREWERYAMIKARPISCDEKANEELQQRLKPFVYRRYLDFSAFSSLREMKKLIDAEVARKDVNKNVKLGPGGIREIEFIGQAFQLIRGGRNPQLQQRGILAILAVVCEMKLISNAVFDALNSAYLFLRKTENTIQAYAEQQTHTLPDDHLQQHRLAYALGFDGWASFVKVLDEHMKTVHEQFESIFSMPQLQAPKADESVSREYECIWLDTEENARAIRLLAKAGYADPVDALEKIRGLQKSSRYKTMGPNGRGRLDKLMPLLISMLGECENSNHCLLRVIRLLEAIAKRTAYIALLTEHPKGLLQLITLFDKSAWVADLLVTHPLLMDELIDARRLYEPMTKASLEQELNYVVDVASADFEHQIQRLIDFKQSNFLRIAASELTGKMPVDKVSDHLTFVAETTLSAVSALATNELSRRYGMPTYVKNNNEFMAGFCVIAYGKLGGLELGFSSDLDLVFLHDSHGAKQITNGEKTLDNAVFYARLGQKIIHILNTPAQGGKLYEVDMRLRPSGAAGILVTSLNSFFEYQKNKAWVWEHQALVRARFICGNEHLRAKFSDIRKTTLCIKRDENMLRKDVFEMRERMRKEFLKNKDGEFDLKQGVGGITDIEFIVQYLVLRWANKYPAIVTFTDNIRLLEALVDKKCLAKDDGKILRQAYLSYRHVAHQCALQGKKVFVDDARFQFYREGISRIWGELMPELKI